MLQTNSELHSMIGGLPFLDIEFNSMQVLSGVAVKRASLSSPIGKSLESVIDPKQARAVYEEKVIQMQLKFPLLPLSEKDTQCVQKQIQRILSAVPSWRELYSLPVEYFNLIDDRVSSTCVLIPQSVFVGHSAFLHQDTLVEAIIHEMAHVWMNLLREIGNFERETKLELYKLPSGTSGKSAAGVLIAAHFAFTATIYYSRLHQQTNSQIERLKYLLAYGSDCIDSLDGCDDLSALGNYVRNRLSINRVELSEMI